MEESLNRHHWVHKWKQKGRCLHCGKSFQQKIFHDKVSLNFACHLCWIIFI